MLPKVQQQTTEFVATNATASVNSGEDGKSAPVGNLDSIHLEEMSWDCWRVSQTAHSTSAKIGLVLAANIMQLVNAIRFFESSERAADRAYANDLQSCVEATKASFDDHLQKTTKKRTVKWTIDALDHARNDLKSGQNIDSIATRLQRHARANSRIQILATVEDWTKAIEQWKGYEKGRRGRRADGADVYAWHEVVFQLLNPKVRWSKTARTKAENMRDEFERNRTKEK